jgi:hypothetical protein
MAQERPITPEKQLLKLIEDPKAEGRSIQVHAIKHRGISLFSLSAWISRLFFLRGRLRRWFKSGELRQSNIKIINRILVLCILGLAFYLISSVTISMINVRKKPDLDSGIQVKTIKPVALRDTSFLKAASFYLEKIRERNIFEIGYRKQEKPKSAVSAPSPPSSRIMEATQHLRLVGIAWSEDPDVMIEDTKAMKTFFVKRGQMIGELKVQAIFRDKVVLSYGDEEIELK